VTALGNFIVRDPRCIASLDTGSRDHLELPKGHLNGGDHRAREKVCCKL
jgi:hypothetical protein